MLRGRQISERAFKRSNRSTSTWKWWTNRQIDIFPAHHPLTPCVLTKSLARDRSEVLNCYTTNQTFSFSNLPLSAVSTRISARFCAYSASNHLFDISFNFHLIASQAESIILILILFLEVLVFYKYILWAFSDPLLVFIDTWRFYSKIRAITGIRSKYPKKWSFGKEFVCLLPK